VKRRTLLAMRPERTGFFGKLRALLVEDYQILGRRRTIELALLNVRFPNTGELGVWLNKTETLNKATLKRILI